MQTSTATSADADAIVALWQACGLTRPWNDPHADFAQAIANPTSTVLLARDADTLIGAVMVGFDGHRGWIYYLGVIPARQRQRLGVTLMAAAEDWLRACGAPKLQLMVRNDNQPALDFYAALGLELQPVVTLGKRLDT